jgi:hypothetical protein
LQLAVSYCAFLLGFFPANPLSASGPPTVPNGSNSDEERFRSAIVPHQLMAEAQCVVLRPVSFTADCAAAGEVALNVIGERRTGTFRGLNNWHNRQEDQHQWR